MTLELPAQQLLFIDGRWTAGAHTRKHRDRWTGDPVAIIHEASAAQADAAIDAAHRALVRGLPVHERALVLERVRDLLHKDAELIARTITTDTGKPIAASRAEVERAVITVGLAAEEAKRLPGEVVPLDAAAAGAGMIGFTVPEPRGVVAAITPFNFPLNLVVHKVAPAIAAGCPVVLKPSDRAPLTAGLLVAAFDHAGLPEGFLNLVIGPPAELVARLQADDRVKVVTFTGSSAVGWALKAAAPRKHHVLELGSNTAMVVAADADLEAAADAAALASLSNSGQACVSLQRVYVERAVVDRFGELLVDRFRAVGTGDPYLDTTVVGPLITDADVSRLAGWIAEAVDGGATALVTGESKDAVLAPTLLRDVDVDSRLIREEAFGPVLSIVAVDDLDEAIRLTNDSRFGLNTAIYTDSVTTAIAFARRADAGSVLVNVPPSFRSDQMPYGGVKESGQGREGVKYAVEEFTRQKLVVVRS